jgi:hypothetical protein
MADSLNTTALVTVLGDYCRENKEDLFLGIMNGDDILANRSLVPMEAKDEVPLPRVDVGKFLRPRTDENFSPVTDAMAVDARILKVQKVKGDLKFIPDEFRATWLQHLATNRIKPSELPLEAFFLQAIIAGANRDVAEDALYKGLRNNAGATAAATLTGYITLLTNGTLGDGSPAMSDTYMNESGALTSANIIDSVDATFDLLHDKQQNNALVKAYMSPAKLKMYARAVRDTYNTTISEANGGKRKWYIYDTDVEIVPEIGLSGTDNILMTDVGNMCVGFDNKLDSSSIRIQEFDRYLKVMLDFEMGLQFREVTNGRVALNVHTLPA